MDDGNNRADGADFIDGTDPEALREEEQLQPTPEQHERLKDGLHGELFDDIRRADRRYLVIGRGSDAPGERRAAVCEQLDERLSAVAFRLEEFGFSGEEVDLWVPAFEILSEMASRIVAIVEDYDGGHVWELGYLYRYQTTVRNALWMLKRVYETESKRRERYDNGMAASHMAALEKAVSERVIGWESPDDLPRAVERVP
ncbi:aminopeptidase [Natrarchaeobius halalkaliphilus]|uniref:Aminopeptidase n=1 Tax=Natrarchaeobius halalkaliphilus TaxID=1679091 RepID=A0A3N6LZ66_9EURY|nr:aminopeptidase [Natrarchaeobius halalkaliphilus]RQG93194.1 aminopeptidase [Natrarchaeobius halalkaliphilus]